MRPPESEEVSDTSEELSGEFTESAKSEVDSSEKETTKVDEVSEREQIRKRSVCGESIAEEDDMDANGSEDTLVVAKKQEEERRMFEELEHNVLTTTTEKSGSEAASEVGVAG